VWTNSGARPGDALILTKALGTGVIATALKKGNADPAWVTAAVESMRMLNRKACETAVRVSAETEDSVHGATDVTGFGLLGHAREMALASNVTLELDHTRVAALTGALESIRQKAVPAGLNNNREFASCSVSMATNVPAEMETLLYDPQTSGGLLIAIAGEHAEKLESALREVGVLARVIGRVRERSAHPIEVR
jgi:selenide,water dikinase